MKSELGLLGKIHRKARKIDPYLRDLPVLRKYPVHLGPLTGLHYLAHLRIDTIDEEPDDIFSYEWDNLLILDACRHDFYEEVNGETEHRITKASMSKGFIRENFSEGDYSDVVYVTANPYFSPDNFKKITGREVDEVFHEVFHTYETDWDDEENTVLAESVARDARTARKLFPDRKMIVHFMQPHHPFVGQDFIDEGFESINGDGVNQSEWDLAMRGELSQKTVSGAYRENLEYVMPYAEELAEEMEGETMLTADHGNLMGENGLYWHPPKSKAIPLRKVPMTEL